MSSADLAAPATSTARTPASVWAGRVMSALPVLGLLTSASMKLAAKPEMVSMFTGKLGYPAAALLPIAIAELACAILYAVPRTSVFGAILMTGYLGGAVATHVRISEAFVPAIVLGVLAWGGLFLRDERIRTLLPLRKPLS